MTFAAIIATGSRSIYHFRNHIGSVERWGRKGSRVREQLETRKYGMVGRYGDVGSRRDDVVGCWTSSASDVIRHLALQVQLGSTHVSRCDDDNDRPLHRFFTGIQLQMFTLTYTAWLFLPVLRRSTRTGCEPQRTAACKQRDVPIHIPG